jgi:hypothetical protein
MALTLSESQVEAAADRANGDVIEAPFAGLLTLTGSDALTELSVVTTLPTVKVTSVTHEAPWSPHAFTCSVCLPIEADTLAFTELLSTTVVSVLLSSENPMAFTG